MKTKKEKRHLECWIGEKGFFFRISNIELYVTQVYTFVTDWLLQEGTASVHNGR